jgi:hypothetical protein
MLLDAGMEILPPGTNDSVDLLTVLNEEEGRHRLDFVLRSNILQLVNIDLQEDGASELFGKFNKHGGDGAARTTPGGSEVNDHLRGKTS